MQHNFNARLDSLTPKLVKIAEIYAPSTLHTAEDLYHDMVVYLLERQAKNPSFGDQNDSYILDAGRMGVCLPAIKRAKVESKYTCGEPQPLDDESDYFFDTLPGPGVNPETACENLEQALALAEVLRDRLSNQEQTVLSLAVKGVTTNEIASQLKISPAAISVYKRRIANKLQYVNL